jgi:hypothetical protein
MLIVFFLVLKVAVAQQNVVSVNAAEGKYVINKNIYGHFAEHRQLYL